jgi:sugar phosphate isomerase/epimerase
LARDDFHASIRNNLDILRHFHVSEPYLAGFSAPQIDHGQVAAILRDANYEGWISLEMRETDQPLRDVQQAAEFLVKTYSKEN